MVTIYLNLNKKYEYEYSNKKITKIYILHTTLYIPFSKSDHSKTFLSFWK